MNEKDLQRVLRRFLPDQGILACTPYGSGHINRTFLVTSAGGRYILQKISETLTNDPAGLMDNIVKVTDHLKKKETDPRRVLTPVANTRGGFLEEDEAGNFRMFGYVENSFCLEKAESTDDFYESALAFGRFEELLKDFPVNTLKETLPDFHNTPMRCRMFHRALERNPAGRREAVEKEVTYLLEREERMGLLQRMRDAGKLPVRVTHNDTKLSNVLFDRDTRKALCVIDLDTVMPGLSLYDFGDAIRYGASTASEDEHDLSKVGLSVPMYQAFREGFLHACPDLSAAEKDLLPMGAWVITMEQAARFLTDYLNGDIYYHTSYPDQNLCRTRTQLKLAQEMERHWNHECAI